MIPAPTTLAGEGATRLLAGWRSYRAAFAQLTATARRCFERRDWGGTQRVSRERLESYRRAVDWAVADLADRLGPRWRDPAPWRDLKRAFGEAIAELPEVELAETYFNSITRRVFTTVGIDPEIEFVHLDSPLGAADSTAGETERLPREGSLADLLRTALRHHELACGWEDFERDVALGAAALERGLAGHEVAELELVRHPFFRRCGAYLVGRVRGPHGDRPLVLALTNPSGRVVLDAVLTDEDDVSVVFSFTRSYFLVDTDRPSRLVRFLKEIIPKKPISELYNSVGHNKHGKTELYRAILHHLATTDDRFEIARGERGMVMLVFNLPGFDLVFKMIRDRFAYPKSTTRQEVMDKYRLVFQHDKAGRMVDAQEFEHLVFDRQRFSDELLAELERKVPTTARIDAGEVALDHLYTERRLVPLDVYLREAPPAAARAAVLDYGRALRDLAATNIFPGDLLLKNFGVTRHHRVVFYDYDELCLLDECQFRDLPAARSDEEETAAEAWYYVGERDIFPEEFLAFLGLRGELREAFLAAHGELLTADFWRGMQAEHRAGHWLDVFPYPPDRRLQAAPGR